MIETFTFQNWNGSFPWHTTVPSWNCHCRIMSSHFKNCFGELLTFGTANDDRVKTLQQKSCTNFWHRSWKFATWSAYKWKQLSSAHMNVRSSTSFDSIIVCTYEIKLLQLSNVEILLQWLYVVFVVLFAPKLTAITFVAVAQCKSRCNLFRSFDNGFSTFVCMHRRRANELLQRTLNSIFVMVNLIGKWKFDFLFAKCNFSEMQWKTWHKKAYFDDWKSFRIAIFESRDWNTFN